jgi:hypothetical protein
VIPRTLKPTLVCCLAICSLAALSCGDDDAPPFERVVIDIRDGQWEVTRVTSVTGPLPGQCPDEGDTVYTQDLCELDLTGDTGGIFTIVCDDPVDDGASFSFECHSDFEAPPECAVRATNRGSGTYSDTTFTLTSIVVTDVLGGAACDTIYSQFDAPCTTTVVYEGQWMGELSVPGSCEDLQ